MSLIKNPFHSLDDWKKAAAAGAAPTGVLLRKQYVPDAIKGEDGSRKLSFTISTGAVDRDRDTLKVDGWKLDNYLKNPVVLWAHRYGERPIARAESVIISAGALRATAEFVPKEVFELADSVFQMLKLGFLRATSVGFRPLAHNYNDERRGYDFTEQELLEFSVVPVPANPEALLDAKSAGVDIAPLKSWAERILDEIEPGLWLPKAAAERALKIAAGEPESVTVPPSTPVNADPPAAVKTDEPPPPAEPFVPSLDQMRAAFRSAISESAKARINHARGRLD